MYVPLASSSTSLAPFPSPSLPTASFLVGQGIALTVVRWVHRAVALSCQVSVDGVAPVCDPLHLANFILVLLAPPRTFSFQWLSHSPHLDHLDDVMQLRHWWSLSTSSSKSRSATFGKQWSGPLSLPLRLSAAASAAASLPLPHICSAARLSLTPSSWEELVFLAHAMLLVLMAFLPPQYRPPSGRFIHPSLSLRFSPLFAQSTASEPSICCCSFVRAVLVCSCCILQPHWQHMLPLRLISSQALPQSFAGCS